MIFEFGEFRLDTSGVELRGPQGVIPLEPKCYTLLKTLVEDRDRAVPKDELFETVWPGVFVTDASLSTAVKQLRAALGDDGERQAFVKTVRGIGFRFVAETKEVATARGSVSPAPSPETTSLFRGKPTVAVRPFQLIGHDPAHKAIAEAIPSEIIATLSKLQSVTVIARGSSFRFDAGSDDTDTMSTQLGARYLVSGVVEWMGPRIALYVEVIDAENGQLIWSDRRTGALDEIFDLRANAVRDLSVALEIGISNHEAERLAYAPSESLDAWGHYHLGVRHIYRYNTKDNEIAAHHFARALELDNGFSRAHSGLSYTEFQNAFQYFGTDIEQHKSRALHHAENAMQLGELDPFCNLIYGRAKWLVGDVEDGLDWVNRSIQLNPNNALGYYNNATLNSILCNGETADASVGNALVLSPMDPQLQSMYGTRALATFVAGDLGAANRYSELALNVPRPHLYVFIIAAAVFQTLGNSTRAEYCVRRIRELNAPFGKSEFFAFFRFRDPQTLKRISDALEKLGL